MGSTSSNFIRNTIVVPFNCELTSIIFNARGATGIFTATVWKQSPNASAIATTLSTVVVPSLFFNVTNSSVLCQQGDLISVQLSTGSSLGAAVSITYKALQ